MPERAGCPLASRGSRSLERLFFGSYKNAPRGWPSIDPGNSFAGYWGEVLTVAAEAAGIAALVIDGGVRDIAALTAR